MTTVTDIEAQIAELEAQKRTLIADEKKSAIKKAQLAIDELNALGFNYSLVEKGSAPSRTRRTGIRQEVLAIIKEAAGDISRSDLLQKLEAETKSAQQSISNALAALKKSGEIEGERGVYRTK